MSICIRDVEIIFICRKISRNRDKIVRKTSATDRDVLLAGLRRRNNKERDRKMIAAGGREAGGAVCYMLQWVKCLTVSVTYYFVSGKM